MPHLYVSDEQLATMIEALTASRQHNDEWGYQWGSTIQNQIYARLDAALAALQAPAQDGEWVPVPSSLEYPAALITYAIQNGEIPVEYKICRRVNLDTWGNIAALREIIVRVHGMATGQYVQDDTEMRRRIGELLTEVMEGRRTSQPAGVEGIDAPDSPGWWAWSDEYEHGVSEVYASDQELILSDEPGGLTPWHFSGRTWYRLHMPWERQRPGDAPGGKG